MKRGFFITFEGGDGSGKSSHARLVAERLEREGRSVVLTREPGDTPAGKKMRDILLEYTLTPRSELFLFFADRAQHVKECIRPALERGDIIICDRFSGSTVAYQLGGRALTETDLVMAMDAYARESITPDLTVYLDIDPQLAMQRRFADTTQEHNRFDTEEIAFHQRVRESFLTQAQQPGWITIETAGSQEENHEKIYTAISSHLP